MLKQQEATLGQEEQSQVTDLAPKQDAEQVDSEVDAQRRSTNDALQPRSESISESADNQEHSSPDAAQKSPKAESSLSSPLSQQSGSAPQAADHEDAQDKVSSGIPQLNLDLKNGSDLVDEFPLAEDGAADLGENEEHQHLARSPASDGASPQHDQTEEDPFAHLFNMSQQSPGVRDADNIELDFSELIMFRAKLYKLDQQGRWHDLGTGHFMIEQLCGEQWPSELGEQTGSRYKMTLKQEQEPRNDLLPQEFIQAHIMFSRQRETIITWSDSMKDQDLAVSFQNNFGAQYTWEKICQILGKDPNQMEAQASINGDGNGSGANGNDGEYSPQNDEQIIEGAGADSQHYWIVTLDNLPRLAEELADQCQQQQMYHGGGAPGGQGLGGAGGSEYEAREDMCDQFLQADQQNLHRLAELFTEVEQELQRLQSNPAEADAPYLVRAEDNLTLFFQVFKGLIQLNVEHMIEVLVSDRFYMATFGALEWDPEAITSKTVTVPINSSNGQRDADEAMQVNGDQENKEGSHSPKGQQTATVSIGVSSTLQYRNFLTEQVNFKKVVDLSGGKGDDSAQQNQDYNNNDQFSLEQRIHINYRLTYLKDTVMARYIDDACLKTINQLIQRNNHDICNKIFFDYRSGSNSIKDQIFEKIRQQDNMMERFQAIEFIIELCQVLKSLQFSAWMPGGGQPMMYRGGGKNGYNSMEMVEQLNQSNLIGLLAESINIFVPSEDSLDAHLSKDTSKVLEYYKEQSKLDDNVLKTLLESTKERNQLFEDGCDDGLLRIDQMKVNSLEIIITFYMSAGIQLHEVNKFVLCEDQMNNNTPFLSNLVTHLIYAKEQALKVQISDFFKQLLECEQGVLSGSGAKNHLYRVVIKAMVVFLQKFAQDFGGENRSRQSKPSFPMLRYSTYLIMQVLNKVVCEHRYPFSHFVTTNNIIPIVASLAELHSKLLDVEIIKFYKGLLRSKDQGYLERLKRGNLFSPVFDIFKRAYHGEKPGMVISVCRDLFEQVFRKTHGNKNMQQNCAYDQRFVDYLVVQHEASKQIIFDEQYADIFKKYNLVNYNELFEDPHDSQHSSFIAFSQSDYSHDTDTLVAGPRNRRSFNSKRIDPLVVDNLLSSRPSAAPAAAATTEQDSKKTMPVGNMDVKTWADADPRKGTTYLQYMEQQEAKKKAKQQAQQLALSTEDRDRQLLFDCEPTEDAQKKPSEQRQMTSSQQEDALNQLMEGYNKSDSDQSDGQEPAEAQNSQKPADNLAAEDGNLTPLGDKTLEKTDAEENQATAQPESTTKEQAFCSIRKIELEVAAKEDEPAAENKQSLSAALSDDGRAPEPLDEKDQKGNGVLMERINSQNTTSKVKPQRKNGSREKHQLNGSGIFSAGKLSMSAAKSEDANANAHSHPSSPRSLGDPRSEQSEKHLGRSAFLLGAQDGKDIRRIGMKPRACTSQFSLSSNAADQSDRVSNHSHSSAAALQDYVGGEDELAKDTGIFNVDLNGGSNLKPINTKSISVSQDVLSEQQRRNSFEAVQIGQKRAIDAETGIIKSGKSPQSSQEQAEAPALEPSASLSGQPDVKRQRVTEQ